MTGQFASLDQYEEDANRMRSRLGATMSELRENLAPGNLADEIARGAGIDNLSASRAFEFACKRHPLATLAAGVGVGLWALSVARSRSHYADPSDAATPLRDTAASLARSASDVFRRRASAKRQEFVDTAKSNIIAGASQICDVVEKGIDEFIGKIPASPSSRPLIESAIRAALLAVFEALSTKSRQHR